MLSNRRLNLKWNQLKINDAQTNNFFCTQLNAIKDDVAHQRRLFFAIKHFVFRTKLERVWSVFEFFSSKRRAEKKICNLIIFHAEHEINWKTTTTALAAVWVRTSILPFSILFLYQIIYKFKHHFPSLFIHCASFFIQTASLQTLVAFRTGWDWFWLHRYWLQS